MPLRKQDLMYDFKNKSIKGFKNLHHKLNILNHQSCHKLKKKKYFCVLRRLGIIKIMVYLVLPIELKI